MPNYLQVQLYTKVSASYGVMKALGTALEMYAIDNNKYPLQAGVGVSGKVVYSHGNPKFNSKRHKIDWAFVNHTDHLYRISTQRSLF